MIRLQQIKIQERSDNPAKPGMRDQIEQEPKAHARSETVYPHVSILKINNEPKARREGGTTNITPPAETRDSGEPAPPIGNQLKQSSSTESRVGASKHTDPLKYNIYPEDLCTLPIPTISDPIIHPSICDDIDINSLTDTIRGNGKFRLENKFIHLTYSYQFDEKLYFNHISEIIKAKDTSIEVYSIVKEFGKRKTESGKPYAHLHAAFKFNKSITITNPKFFDYKSDSSVTDQQSHCHIKAIPRTKWDYICGTYHTKDGIPFTNYSPKKSSIILADLQECDSEYDVVKLASEIGQIHKSGQYIKAWEHRNRPKSPTLVKPFDKFYEWQQSILNTIENDVPNDRSVEWIYNEDGSMGKSSFAEYLKSQYNACILTTTNVKDAIHAVGNHIDKYGSPNIVIIDIARSSKFAGIYAIIESLKGRNPTSGKYNSRILEFKKYPMIFIFSNSFPEIHELSLDRWIIHVSGFNGENYEYTFAGNHGKILIENYKNIEILKEQAAKDRGIEYIPCFPTKIQRDIDAFDLSIGHLSRKNRKLYWDRHVYPVITVTHKVPTSIYDNSNIIITELPMTPEEVINYEDWKKSSNSTEYFKNSSSIKSSEMLKLMEISKVKALETFIKKIELNHNITN